MKPKTTVIYYTSNHENPDFEKKIQRSLRENAGHLPIVTVSQKPIEFGDTRVVVGDVGRSDHNVYRQIQLACHQVNTEYVTVAESDCLYPPEYFDFIPPDDNEFYRYGNVWILYHRFNYYFKKSSSECALVVKRQKYIDFVDKLLKGRDLWSKPDDAPLKNIFDRDSWKIFGFEWSPVINIKSGKSMRQFTNTLTNTSDIGWLPYWGHAIDLKKAMGI